MGMKILVADKIAQEGLKILENGGKFQVDFKPAITKEEMLEQINEYDALVIRSRSKAPADLLEKAEKLKVVGRAGVGLDNVDIPAATRCGIIVMNTPDGNTISAAEHAVSLLMSISRNIPQADLSMKEGRWDKKKLAGVELYGKTLGVIGLGRIGRHVAKCALAFEMKVIGFDPQTCPETIKKLGIETASIEEIITRSDYISLHTPLNDATRGMIGEEQFKMMKDSARIINCARGGIVKEDDLVKALEEGLIAGAAFDVFATEPLPEDSPLRKAKNIILTPHLGASTAEAQEKVAVQVARQIVTVLSGGEIINAVNAPSLDPELLKLMRPSLDLAEKLGTFSSRYAQSRVVKITCSYSGTVLEYPLVPLTTAIVKGFMEPTTDLTVNYVNALNLAEERGIEIIESRSSSEYQYTNLITIEVEMENGEKGKVSGTLYSKEMPRLVILNDKHFNAIPDGNMLLIKNKDVPGIIGAVATILGNHKINITQMTWGSSKSGEDAKTIINTDQEISAEIIKDLDNLPDVLSVRFITV
jgi:D-3-phosphoglycerate dehydrogenase / 2-oxoglutarate reductase